MGPLEMRLPSRGATQYTDLSGLKILFLADSQACFDTLFSLSVSQFSQLKKKGTCSSIPCNGRNSKYKMIIKYLV